MNQAERPLLEPLRGVVRWIASGQCYIQDRETRNVVPLVPRGVQRRVLRAMLKQAEAGKPIRVIVPKYRQGGVSTIIQAVIRRLCATIPNRDALTSAHTDPDTTKIFGIAKLMQEKSGEPGKISTRSIEFPNDSLYECRTGAGKGVGRGSGFSYVHITELAKLQSVQGLDAQAISSILNTVANSPHSIIAIEGTGEGPVGELHRLVMQAVRGEGEFELVFLPWFEDEKHVIAPPEGFTLSKEDAAIQTAFKLSLPQMCWRRNKLSQHRDLAHFKREHPSTVAECFEVSSGRIFATFNPAPLDQGGHVGKLDIGSDWERYRFIDWGWTVGHPTVCLWVAHDPHHSPRLVIDPSCAGVGDYKGLIEELIAYARDEKTGEPIKAFDHGPDALRIGAVTAGITGLLYVYRAAYFYEMNVTGDAGACREIHRLSGRDVDMEYPGADDLGSYQDGAGEKYLMNIADRSNAGMIHRFTQWGIPCVGHMRPAKKTNPDGTTEPVREVEDGIAHVQALLLGNALFLSPITSDVEKIRDKVAAAQSGNRPKALFLTKDERKTLDRDRGQPSDKRRNPISSIGGDR